MPIVALALSLLLIATVLWDAFETVILPRTVRRRFRVAGMYVRGTWALWKRLATGLVRERRREWFLAIYGPFSLLGLAAIWACGLVVGFAGLHWVAGSHLRPAPSPGFADDIYMSGTTFFTLGLGDLQPFGGVARLVTVAEAGTGFAFLAVIVAYLPVLYQSFSRREARLTLLDAWAGSPPAAVEVLCRLAARGEVAMLPAFLKDWESWCSDLLESHISYPVVGFFRSQHSRQSWVSALAVILDVSALIETGIDGIPTWQAHVTFAMARHTAVDLLQVLQAAPDPRADRISDADLDVIRRRLEDAGLRPDRSPRADRELRERRRSYEPYLAGLAQYLMMPLPSWWYPQPVTDNWQTSPKEPQSAHL